MNLPTKKERAEIRERVEANYFMCSHAASIFDATSLLALVDEMAKALAAPTHEANDYNCQEPPWDLSQDCPGCTGDAIRHALLTRLKGE